MKNVYQIMYHLQCTICYRKVVTKVKIKALLYEKVTEKYTHTRIIVKSIRKQSKCNDSGIFFSKKIIK